jgi:hypothetical protein
VLDVGCGPNGLACALDGVPFVGVDVEFPVDVARHEAATLRDAWLELYRNACFGESGRKGWVLERIAPRAPLATPDDVEATAIAALRCPECNGAVAV